jgi:hypothetical protein
LIFSPSAGSPVSIRQRRPSGLATTLTAVRFNALM